MHKKLLFVITQGVVGGAQKNVFDLANSFKTSYEVFVAMGGEKDSNLASKLSAQKIQTHHLKFLGRDINILDDFLVFFEILKLYKKEKPDIVHLHSSKVGLIGSLAAFFYKLKTNNHKLKTVFTAHGWIFKEDISSKKRFVTVFLAWLAAKFQDKIICVSEDDFNKALKHKIAPARKLFIVYNAVNKENFLSKGIARAEISKMIGKELSEDDFVITNFGRLYNNKSLNYLIESIKELKQKVILVIFGDGPERQTLQGMVDSYKLGNNIFLVGDKSNASQYLKAFDAMVLSSTKEGFPYALLEAGMAGVPVVATNVGGVGEIIKDGETGILIEPKNVEVLSKSILKIYNDKEFSQKISVNLKKIIVKDFSFENLIEKTDWIYKA
ncbi:MAG: glycosyltransferase family 4 protein [bacterium]|nr:glycosyltransferase family 4 protein [bacterium]